MSSEINCSLGLCKQNRLGLISVTFLYHTDKNAGTILGYVLCVQTQWLPFTETQLCNRHLPDYRQTCWVCVFLFVCFFLLSRVCVKKSTQERLALKILIDRPKARNEVRGNTAVGVINACCLLSLAISICFVPSAWLISVFINSCFSSPRQSVSWDPFVCLYRLFVRSTVFLWDSLFRSLSMSLAAFCFDQAAHTNCEAVRHAVKTSNTPHKLSLLNCEHCHWRADTHRYCRWTVYYSGTFLIILNKAVHWIQMFCVCMIMMSSVTCLVSKGNTDLWIYFCFFSLHNMYYCN